MGETEAGSSKKSAEDEFSPMGIRVLAVDDDATCLRYLQGILVSCGYKVTVTQHAIAALQLLRENKGNYDIIVTDVRMPDMDGFKLLEIVGLEMDLPVIMLSTYSDVKTVMKGIKHGACDYLVKPARKEEIMLIWKHVMKKSLHNTKSANDATNKPDTLSKSDEDNTSNPTRKPKDEKKDKEEEINDYSDEDGSNQKKHRVAWTVELHSKFIDAINKLGLDRAVPKKILDLMDVPGLTRENVASHLQKYRKALKRTSIDTSQLYHGCVGSSGCSASTTNSVLLSFNNQGPVSSLGGFRAEGYQNHQRTIPLAHVPQSRIGQSYITPTWLPLPLSHQANLHQHYSSAPQASQLRTNHFVSASNPLVMDAGTPQLTSKHPLYQSLIPRLNQPSSFIDNSQIHWLNEMNYSSSSINQQGRMPNQRGVDSIFEHNSGQGDLKDTTPAGLNGLAPMQCQQDQPHQFSAQTGADLGLGTQIDGNSMDPKSSEQKQSKGTSSPELLAQFLESPQEESIFHLSNGDSADDLHSAIKQFQGSKETTEGDNL